ncbi:MAG: GNAT family N-acetyltransferase [Clostridia bacterium]|nr:GNAT family N-acetyltransferase [Clostridia bacterium]
MIKYVTGQEEKDFILLCGRANIYACRIGCLWDSYGQGFPDVYFWIQYTDGLPSAAIAKWNNDVTVLLTDSSDVDELREFLSITGFGSVLSEKVIFPDMAYSEGIVMERQKAAVPTQCPYSYVFDEQSPLNKVHQLLWHCRGNGFAVPCLEDFLLDVSHKLRHHTAGCIAVMDHEKCISFAMTTALTASCAVIGAVATDNVYRKKGIGTFCVAELAAHCGSRRILLMRDPDKNEHFYQTSGFQNIGRFVMIERQ